ncbi:hypothetical protein GG804_25705 [Sphingomonas histidinilytica]|uniref:hypothetical protein n=1 Tax=Rhizorhabdus histidinilytica TaxID=439228 RepID=UPI001ADBE0FA|nr:hypothetical protein [Rhizorhabdus histidinilytica]MBO9380168.1 hypothetical protein [Rhizorhabdus histidinilytica]
MSEENGGGGASIITDPNGGGGGGGAPDWMTGLPDDLRGDATLGRYADIEALARGHIEARRLASSRVILPGADADDAAWNSFYDAIGRPKDASEYKIELPEGADAKMADQFRPLAHKLGLTARQVEGLVGWNNELATALQADATAAQEARKAEGIASIEALRSELGADYAAKEKLAQDAARHFGVEAETADKLVEVLGDRKAVELFMRIGAEMGEHRRVDGEPTGGGFGFGGGDPDAMLSAKMKDQSWREKAATAGSPENAEYERLVAAAARKEAVARERKAS